MVLLLVFMQLTRDLFAIAKFLSTTPLKCWYFTVQNVKRDKMTNWLYIIHYSTLKINHTVKLVKLFEKMFIWALLFSIIASKRHFHWSMLLLIKVYPRHQFETVDQLKRVSIILSGTNSQTFINNSIDEWKNVLRLLLRTTGLTLNIFSNNVTNFSVWLIFKVE